MFDTHCHLQDKRIVDRVDDIVDRAADVGVRRMLCCGTSVDDWRDVAAIGERYDNAVCAFGIHPWYVDDIRGDWGSSLIDHLTSDPAAAVGEIGLDNAVAPRNDDKQIDIFTRQLMIAEQFKRPVSIHCRKAWGSLLPILKNTGGLKYGGALHSYSGPPDLVNELEELGCYISFSGSITNKGNKRAAESLKRVSRERLLIETDSPDILPKGAKGEHNVPANLYIIRNRVAEILGVAPEEVGRLTYENGVMIFGTGRIKGCMT